MELYIFKLAQMSNLTTLGDSRNNPKGEGFFGSSLELKYLFMELRV